jgi:hypothetical protein
MIFCSIVAVNYLPQAIVLNESIKRNFPGRHLHLFVIDCNSQRLKDVMKQKYSMDIYYLNEISSSSYHHNNREDYYDIVELATSLKPTVLLFFLKKFQKESVTYLDPDIVIYKNFSQILDFGNDYNCLLTPHRLEINRDSVFLEQIIMKYGVYNLGFISVSQDSLDFLRWWEDRLKLFSSRVPNEVIFTDQRWCDFVGCYANPKILKDHGLNVAPWNIDERRLTKIDNLIYCDGSPMYFIHFSQLSLTLLNNNVISQELYDRYFISPDDESITIFREEIIKYQEFLMKNQEQLQILDINELSTITPGNNLNPWKRKAKRFESIKHNYADLSDFPEETYSSFPLQIIGRYLLKSQTIVLLILGFNRDLRRLLKKLFLIKKNIFGINK